MSFKQCGFKIETAKGHCAEHGDFEASVVVNASGEQSFPPRCPKCPKEERGSEKKVEWTPEQLEAQKRHALERRLEQAGIAPRFFEATFDTHDTGEEAEKKALEACYHYAHSFRSEAAKRGKGMLFLGAPGTGKSRLVACIVRHLVTVENLDPVAASFAQMIRGVKETFRKNAPKTEQEVINHYARAPLLIIEEVGVQYGTDAEKQIIFEIIDERYKYFRPTILTSNLTLPEVEEFLGGRVIDRMREGGGAVIPFSWKSRRG